MQAVKPTCPTCGRDLILVPSGLTCTECLDAKIFPVLLYAADCKTPITMKGVERNVYRRGVRVSWACDFSDKQIRDRLRSMD